MEKTKKLLLKLIEERRKFQYFSIAEGDPERFVDLAEVDEAWLEIRKYEQFYRDNAAIIKDREVAITALKYIRQAVDYAQSKIQN